MTGAERVPTRHPAQWLALAIGVVYTLVGVAGFVVTGFSGFVEPNGELLMGVFEINPVHNIVHLVIGLAGLALWTSARPCADLRLVARRRLWARIRVRPVRRRI